MDLFLFQAYVGHIRVRYMNWHEQAITRPDNHNSYCVFYRGKLFCKNNCTCPNNAWTGPTAIT